jgi:hypothetical protein
MSTYTQPNQYTDTSELRTQHLQNNEESLKDFLNQEIVAGDIDGLSLDKSDIALGRFSPLEGAYSFETGEVVGSAELANYTNRSYQTSTTKNNSQTDPLVKDWQDITNSGCRVHVKQDGAKCLLTMYLHYYVQGNEAPTSSKGPGNGLWQNEIIITYTRGVDSKRFFLGNVTDNYAFDPAGSTLDTLDPWAGDQMASYRSIMTTVSVTLDAGTYNFTASVDPHNEVAYCSVKSMTAEVFYV